MRKDDTKMQSIETTPESLEKAANEIISSSNIFMEAKGQINNLLNTHHMNIYKAYKENGNELKVNLSIGLKGDSQIINVKSTISFMAEKITDELEAIIKLNQPKLPLEGTGGSE